jgi:uncharacterized lipoprotein NlpE involved in copper resistance
MKKALFILVALAVGSCNSSDTADAQADALVISDPVSDAAHASQNSLDYTGTYTGVLPCADCPGIKTEITLNSDSTFTKKMTYLEREEAGIFVEKGTYTRDSARQSITLESAPAPNQYFIGENTLTQLDMQGKKVEGSLANFYVLRK